MVNPPIADAPVAGAVRSRFANRIGKSAVTVRNPAAVALDVAHVSVASASAAAGTETGTATKGMQAATESASREARVRWRNGGLQWFSRMEVIAVTQRHNVQGSGTASPAGLGTLRR